MTGNFCLNDGETGLIIVKGCSSYLIQDIRPGDRYLPIQEDSTQNVVDKSCSVRYRKAITTK